MARLSGQLGYTVGAATVEALLREMAPDRDHVLVATAPQADEVIGWIHVHRVLSLEGGRYGEIRGLVVDDAWRNRGIGSQLLARGMDWTRSRDLPSLHVRSQTFREDAHRFYQRHGFREYKIQRVFRFDL